MDEDRIKTLEFHQELLLEMVDTDKFPFYYLIIKHKVSKQEVIDLLDLCEELNKKYEEQRENGFLHFTPLLVQYVGMLPSVLKPRESIVALRKQNYYPLLMEKLLETIDQIEN